MQLALPTQADFVGEKGKLSSMLNFPHQALPYAQLLHYHELASIKIRGLEPLGVATLWRAATVTFKGQWQPLLSLLRETAANELPLDASNRGQLSPAFWLGEPIFKTFQHHK